MNTTLLELNPQPYLWRFALLAFIFTTIAFALVMFLTGRSVRDGLGGMFSTRTALVLVLPLWCIALGWRYHAEYGGRFYALRATAPNTYELIYAYPAHTVTVHTADIAAWREAVDWTEKFPGRRIEIDLVDGTTRQSSRLHKDDFAALRDRLHANGITLARADQ